MSKRGSAFPFSGRQGGVATAATALAVFKLKYLSMLNEADTARG
jgi:hypothetical protein